MTAKMVLLNLYPSELNLNGDVANTMVLETGLRLLGFDTLTINHEVGAQLPTERPDFIMLGHGSNAAWRFLSEDLTQAAPTLRRWKSAGVAALAIGSGNEACYGGESKTGLPRLGFFDSGFAQIREVERISKFVLVPTEQSFLGEPVLGYQNSATDARVLHVEDNWIGSQLHGPLLAKNPALISWLIKKIVESNPGTSQPPVNKTDPKLAEIVAQIWALETGLASE
jgi:CobQ-like glutamine amidotransferase family enzyme